MIVDTTGVMVLVKYGDSRSNRSRDIRRPYFVTHDDSDVLLTFVQYLITFCSRLEEASDVTSGNCVKPNVSNKRVKFGDPRLNRTRVKFHPNQAAFSTFCPR